MPRLNGIAVCERLKSHPTRRLIPIVILTASNDKETRLRGIAAGADDYLSKPFDSNELLIRTRVLLRERELNARLDATQNVLYALARAVEARDRYTIHHAERVGRYAQEIGALLGFGGDDSELLYEGGVLHDLGKIAIPDAILLKPGRLTEDEMAIMRTHSAAGERICLSLRSVLPADHSASPRTGRWRWLSRSSPGTGDPDRGAHRGRGRCVGRDDQRPAISRRP